MKGKVRDYMKRILHNYCSDNEVNITQIVAYKDNELAIEDYRYDFKRDVTMNVMSVTKSITSLLIGIAIDNGFIKSVNDKVMDYFSKEDYIPKRGEKTIYDVTIWHLLTMTAPYKGKSEPWTKVCTSEDWVLAILDFLGGKEGITGKFSYHTLGTQILLGVIRSATKMNVLDYANEYLFKPLNIKPRINANCHSKEDQFNYLMNRKPHGNVWFMDPKGMPTAGWGLSLSAYEMAQIGLMVLNDGVYNNKRIVSKEWLDEMTKSYVSLQERYGNQDYGYLWWLHHRSSDVIAAVGDGGNVIYVNKKENIVAAVTGYFKPRIFDRVEFIERNIVEALKENK